MKTRKIYFVGWVIPSGNDATSWLHLASWKMLDSQLSLESKMESSVAKSAHKEQASI